MSESNCSQVTATICSIGGHCKVDPSTLEERCICWPGFGPDNSVLHNVIIEDCSLPSSAYLGWLLFQTLANAVVIYRLAKKIAMSKGRIRTINIVWVLILLASWLYVLGLMLQNGLYEVCSIALLLVTNGVVVAGFEMAEMFIEARYAVSVVSPKMALRFTVFVRNAFVLSFATVGIVMAVYARTVYVNTVIYAFLAGILLFGVVISVLLLTHITLLVSTLKSMMGGDMRVSGDQLDEKPALIKRLALFRHVVLIGNVVVIAPAILLIALFSTYNAFPLMWAALILVWQFFPITGLFLNTLNELIRGFRLKKIRAAVGGAAAPIANRPGAPSTPDGQGEQVQLAFSASAPFYGKYRILSKAHLLDRSQSVISHYFGAKAAKIATSMTHSFLYKFFVSTVGPAMMVIAAIELFQKDWLNLNAVIAIGVVIVVTVIAGILSIMNKQVFHRALYFCAAFQLRILLLLAAILSASATLDWSLRSLVISFLDLCALLFFMFDCYRKDEGREYYEFLIFFFASSVPFFVWFILAFDFLDARVNHVLVIGPEQFPWSLYHFTMDMHAFVVWCVFVDIKHLIRNSADNYVYFSCPLTIRYVKMTSQNGQTAVGNEAMLNDRPPSTRPQNKVQLEDGEVDFVHSTTSDNRQSTASSPAPRRKTFLAPSRRETINPATVSDEKRATIATGVVIREDDAIMRFILSDNASVKLLRFQERFGVWTGIVCGLLIGICLGIWAGLVVTQMITPGLSIVLMIIMMVPLGFRSAFKSLPVLMFLMHRFEFFLDALLFCVVEAFIGIALGGTVAIVPGLVALGFIFLDWRTSDASVLPRATTPLAIGYFVPVLVAFLVLPTLVFVGLVPDVSNRTFILVAPLNASSLDGIEDVFSEFNPPKSALSRIRFSQIVFDSMFAFALKLALDFIQHHLRMWRDKSNDNAIVLEYLRGCVAPVLVDHVEPQDLDELFGTPYYASTGSSGLPPLPEDEGGDVERRSHSKANNPGFDPNRGGSHKEPNSSVVPVSDLE